MSVIRIPEREEKDKGTEKIFEEIIEENFPNLKKHENRHTES